MKHRPISTLAAGTGALLAVAAATPAKAETGDVSKQDLLISNDQIIQSTLSRIALLTGNNAESNNSRLKSAFKIACDAKPIEIVCMDSETETLPGLQQVGAYSTALTMYGNGSNREDVAISQALVNVTVSMDPLKSAIGSAGRPVPAPSPAK